MRNSEFEEFSGEESRTPHSTFRKLNCRPSFVKRGTAAMVSLLVALFLLNGTNWSQITPDDWPQTEARLTALLKGDSEQKRTALAEIRGLRHEQASRLAVSALRDNDEVVRATAAAAVIFLPSQEAVRVLLPLLDDKRPFVRREAAYALGQVRHSDVSHSLRRALSKDRDLEVRSALVIALGNIGDPTNINEFLIILNKRPKENEEFLRRSAARAIGQIFEEDASGSTATLTPHNFLPPKFKVVDPIDRSKGTYDLGTFNRILSTLSNVLRSEKESDDTRREAAFALGATRMPAAAAVLRTFINAPDPYLAEISKEGLLKIEAR